MNLVSMAKKILKLSEDASEEATMLAISSHENDYRLSWALNEALSIALSRAEEVRFTHPKLKEEVSFSRYEYIDEDKYLRYQLIANRTENAYLFDELKTFDFLLLLTGEWNTPQIEHLKNTLREISIISANFPAEIKKLKNRKVLDFG